MGGVWDEGQGTAVSQRLESISGEPRERRDNDPEHKREKERIK
jgi:hypothetical protein